MLRRGKEVTVGLACQTFVEDGIEAVFLPPASCPRCTTTKSAISPTAGTSRRVSTRFFPKPSHCRQLPRLRASCPKGIDVEEGVALAAAGRFRDAGEAFLECVMCELCDSACPELIAPAHVGLFCRRITAHFHLRPPNLIYRLEEQRKEQDGDRRNAPHDEHE